MEMVLHLCAHPADEPLADEVEKHLAGALDPKLGVRVTREKHIRPGDDVALEHRAQIERANLVVLLVSADLLADERCRADVDLALARRRSKSAVVVPVICRPCVWEQDQFAGLQALPRDRRPIQDDKGPRESALCEVAEGLRALLPRSNGGAPCPFPGLAFFDEERAADFFGRETEIGDALGKLADSRPPVRWLQIDGPSGAGKSSFARAGIVPAVRAGKLACGPKAWVTAVLRPGHDPIMSLAEALVRHARPGLSLKGRHLDDVRSSLQRSVTALACLVREALPDGHGMLLVVDQLEEAFLVPHADKAAVKQLDALLAEALADREGPLFLVTTIRSDFVARMGELPRLEEELSRQRAVRFYLREMEEAALRAAIERPAARAGLSYEDGLVDRILADAKTCRGALPLVAHVLQELHAARDQHTRDLTVRAYERAGGVTGALTRAADATLDRLDDDGQQRAWKLLLRLVRIGRDCPNTPRDADREAALRAAGGGEEAETVLAHLSGCRMVGWTGTTDMPARLVTVTIEGGRERVDLVHETLLQRWESLQARITKEKRELELRDDVEEAARLWDTHGKEDGWLPKGPLLARFLGVNRAALHDVGRRFLEAAEWRRRRLSFLLAALVLGSLCLMIGALVLVHDLEISKRAQIRQANMNMATMVAGTVLSQLRSLSDAVERVSTDEAVARALASGDDAALQQICEATYDFYDDPSHGLKPNGSPPFNMWFVLDEHGTIKAQVGKPVPLVNLGKNYAWRDYFKGAWKAGEKGLRRPYVSRAHRSENDGFFKFTIAAPIYGGDRRALGVLAAGVAADANLGSLDLEGTQSIAVLVAPRDRERNHPEPESPFLVLRHPAIAYGEGIGMDDEQIRSVSEAAQDGGGSIGRPWWLSGPGRAISSDHHEDPAARTHPGFDGNWLAGLAPVGSTGFVVVVQTRETEATSGTNVFWRLAPWGGVAVVLGALLLLFMAFRERRRFA